MKAALIKHGKDALAAINHMAYIVGVSVLVGCGLGYGLGMGLGLAVKVLL